jgi:S-DNA-T family DNA segregation ATPase FtsK/SpoIIIE
VLGRDVNGDPIFADIDRMPHLLIAGATGSGKSVMIQSLLISLLYKNGPASLKMILVDPKRVELSIYDGLPHLATPVITENKKAVNVFRWAIKEMDRRYDLLLAAGKRDIQGYNKNNSEEPLPYLLIVVDELADLMTTFGKEVEGSIIRLAQMARATGIHLVLSTQRPSVEVITGLIKANITSRIALQVASQIDSRTILDTSGAEKLLGHGDLLFISSEFSKPKRIQGAYVTEEEINKVIGFINEHNEVEVGEELNIGNGNGNGGGMTNPDHFVEESDEQDELYDEALEVVVAAKKASASLLQRRLQVGYARAARLLDLMEMRGVIGPGDGAKPRDVYIDRADSSL